MTRGERYLIYLFAAIIGVALGWVFWSVLLIGAAQ